MRGAFKSICLAVAAVLWLASYAHAGLLNGNAFGIPAFTGSHLMSGTAGSFTVSLAGDFSVFAPGKFQLFLNATDPNNLDVPVINDHVDPSAGTQWVYAYQLMSVALAGSNPGVTNFAVGIDGVSSLNPDPIFNIGWFASYGGKSPTGFALPGSAVRWDWGLSGSSRILNTESSSLLFFTSPRAPEKANSQVSAPAIGKSPSQYAGIPDTPSPGPAVPEPGTLALGFIGFAALTFSKFLRRRTLVQ